jgi:hypothetical protein
MVSLKTWVTSTLRRKPHSFLLAVFAFITGLDSVCRFADNSVELEGHQLLNPFAVQDCLRYLTDVMEEAPSFQPNSSSYRDTVGRCLFHPHLHLHVSHPNQNSHHKSKSRAQGRKKQGERAKDKDTTRAKTQSNSGAMAKLK